MINYYWIIEDILINKPNDYKIIMHNNAINILQMLNLYLKNKCEYKLAIEENNKCFETDTIINVKMMWL